MRKKANPHSGQQCVSPAAEVAREERLSSQERGSPGTLQHRDPKERNEKPARERPWQLAVVLAEAHGTRSPSGGARSCGGGAGLARLVGQRARRGVL